MHFHFTFSLHPRKQEVMCMLPAYFELKSCLVEQEQLVLPLLTNPAWLGTRVWVSLSTGVRKSRL